MDSARQPNTTTWTRLVVDAHAFRTNPRRKRIGKEHRTGCLIELQYLLELVSSRADTVVLK